MANAADGVIGRIGAVTLFAGRVAFAILTPPWHLRRALSLAGDLGWRCLLPVIFVVGPMGAAVSLQGLAILRLFGTERLLPGMLSVAIVREIGPVMAAMMVAAQAGSTIAAELGSMRIKEEIDALDVMAVDPLRWLVVPRVVAGSLLAPLLSTIAMAAGLIGGWLVAVPMKGMSGGTFAAGLFSLIGWGDIVAGVVKASVFGFIITLLATWNGYHVTGGAAGVGRAANRTVVDAAVVVVMINYLLGTVLRHAAG